MTLMNDKPLSLPKRMRAARLLADLEQAEIAARLGVARTTVSSWETGHSEPSATSFVRWADETGQPLEWLAGGVRDDEPPATEGRTSDYSSAGSGRVVQLRRSFAMPEAVAA